MRAPNLSEFEKLCQKYKNDKELATAIKQWLDNDADEKDPANALKDPAAGWHVVVGKSYASAITYCTKNVMFFDLLGDWNKTFLIFKTN